MHKRENELKFMIDEKLFIKLSHEDLKEDKGRLKYQNMSERRNIIGSEYHKYVHDR